MKTMYVTEENEHVKGRHMPDHNMEKIKTLGDLKKSGYAPRSIKDEMRENLIRKLKKDEPLFPGIIGYERTVIPEVERAILSRHNMIFLGLRGQAKTRMARLMENLLDPYIPVVSGSELNDDPLRPISRYARDLIAAHGDDTPVSWIHKSERYTEKLATPDVTIADLIGDVDPIKAANLKLPFSDERVLHYGLIPRAHRSIFVINELPDLQARIQVALFNILQEEDIQIRGFKLRLPLDIQFVFTANPEDYTNRGSIVTPLKDRIDSQILTHYPRTLEDAGKITAQEARITPEQRERIFVPQLIRVLIEECVFQARESEYVDQNSGVSARLTISALENVYSTAERRMLLNKETSTTARISDLYGAIPSITGKVELVYEGEQEGPLKIAHILINNSIRKHFKNFFPDPEKARKNEEENPYAPVVNWFNDGKYIELLLDAPRKSYEETLNAVEGVGAVVDSCFPDFDSRDKMLMKEFLLYGLAEFSFLSKTPQDDRLRFRDMLSGMMPDDTSDEDNIFI